MVVNGRTITRTTLQRLHCKCELGFFKSWYRLLRGQVGRESFESCQLTRKQRGFIVNCKHSIVWESVSCKPGRFFCLVVSPRRIESFQRALLVLLTRGEAWLTINRKFLKLDWHVSSDIRLRRSHDVSRGNFPSWRLRLTITVPVIYNIITVSAGGVYPNPPTLGSPPTEKWRARHKE